MDERYYTLLMNDYFLQTDISSSQKKNSPYAISMEGFGVLLVAYQPSGWVTLFLKVGERPKCAGEQWFHKVLTENARLDKIMVKSSLGTIENTLVQWAQRPLEHLSVQTLRQWVEQFLGTAKTNRNHLIIN